MHGMLMPGMRFRSVGGAQLIAMLLLVSLASCTKTIVETHDVPVHDTTTIWTKGRAFVRFLSMLPNQGSISLSHSVSGSILPFDAAVSYTTGTGYPVPDSMAFTVYCHYTIATKSFDDSLPVPALPAHAERSYIFFAYQNPDTKAYFLQTTACDDSMKNIPAPSGYCYLRVMNGVNDFPTPRSQVYVYLNGSDTSLFTDPVTKAKIPLAYGDVQNYKLIKAGDITIDVKDDAGNLVHPTASRTTFAGQYYTLRRSGSHADGTDKIVLDGPE